jgi:hypothetical protein
MVLHTAVLGYVPRTGRLQSCETVGGMDVVWVCNEAPEVVSEIAATTRQPPAPDSLLMSANRHPVAWTEPRGRSIEWRMHSAEANLAGLIRDGVGMCGSCS